MGSNLGWHIRRVCFLSKQLAPILRRSFWGSKPSPQNSLLFGPTWVFWNPLVLALLGYKALFSYLHYSMMMMVYYPTFCPVMILARDIQTGCWHQTTILGILKLQITPVTNRVQARIVWPLKVSATDGAIGYGVRMIPGTLGWNNQDKGKWSKSVPRSSYLIFYRPGIASCLSPVCIHLFILSNN